MTRHPAHAAHAAHPHRTQRSRRSYPHLVLLAALLAAAMALSTAPGISAWTAGAPSATERLRGVWDRAKASGSYHFSADILQTSAPLATVGNVGRQSKQDRLHVEGQ